MFRRKSSPTVVTTRGLSKVMLEKRVMFVPAYSEKEERELIVIPRGTIYGQNPKKKKPINL